MEWTNGLIFEFLNLYQDEPTLWNSMTPEHKNKSDAYDAWNRIKSKLKDGTIPIKEIKKKRDNLMSTYRRQRTKVTESMSAANGTDEVFKPEWPFYSIMATFLDDIYKPKKIKYFEEEAQLSSADNSSELPTHEANEAIMPQNLLDSQVPFNSSADNNYQIGHQLTKTNESTMQWNLLDSQLPQKKLKQASRKSKKQIIVRKRKVYDDNSIFNALQRLQNVSRVVNTPQPTLTYPQDEFYFFALSVAAQLRNLPLHIAIDTQSNIQHTLSTARLSTMVPNTSSPSSYNYSSTICDQPSRTQVHTTNTQRVSYVEIEPSQQNEQFVPDNIKQEPESDMT